LKASLESSRGAFLRFQEVFMSDTLQFWKDLKSGRFVSMVKESAKGQRLSNSQEVYNVLKPTLAEEDDVEKVYIIFLDAQNQIIAIEKIFSGSITASSIHPREIVKRLIQLKASAFVMAHNHPSGQTTPSSEDKSITIKVGIAAASIDVALHDHLIIGDGYHSMADTGWLKKVSGRFSNLLKPELQREGGDHD
jgi:DNA repair protein RadC